MADATLTEWMKLTSSQWGQKDTVDLPPSVRLSEGHGLSAEVFLPKTHDRSPTTRKQTNPSRGTVYKTAALCVSKNVKVGKDNGWGTLLQQRRQGTWQVNVTCDPGLSSGQGEAHGHKDTLRDICQNSEYILERNMKCSFLDFDNCTVLIVRKFHC